MVSSFRNLNGCLPLRNLNGRGLEAYSMVSSFRNLNRRLSPWERV